jgi:hypothetical protein
MRRLSWLPLLSCLCVPLLALAGCGDDGPDDGPADAAPPDAALADAGVDAAAPDAGAPCPGQALFTGSYQDWDGNSAGPSNTLGTVVAEAADPDNATTITAPNGRVTLCLPADETSLVTFTNDDYLPLRYTFDPTSRGTAFEIQGLTPARADELFAELGLTPDPLLAQVIVAVRYETANPEAVGAGAEGVRVALSNASAGTFTPDEAGVLGAGDTLAGGAFVLFANTEPVSETTTVTVTPPSDVGCSGPDLVSVAAGEIAVTTFSCVILPK